MKMAYEYGLISQINTKKSNDWNKKIYLTFDIDWAHDEIIQDVILILEEYSASATFFATHKSKFLDNYFGKRENFEIQYPQQETNMCFSQNWSWGILDSFKILPQGVGRSSTSRQSESENCYTLSIWATINLFGEIARRIMGHPKKHAAVEINIHICRFSVAEALSLLGRTASIM